MDVADADAAPPLEAPHAREPAGEQGADTADLVVPFKIALDGELSACMVRALVKYLLYLRGQIPCVYEEFDAMAKRQQLEEEAARAAGSRKRKLVSGDLKKARRLVEVADQLLESSLFLLFERRVRSVALVFGATVASPRELWRVDFHGCSTPTAPGGAQVTGKAGGALSRERVAQLCVQKIIRSVLSYATQHFSSSVAVTSLHLLVLAEKSDVAVEGFVPKQLLRLREPKPKRQGKRSHLIKLIQATSTTSSPTGAEGDGHGDDNPRDDAFVWYQSTRPLQGVTKFA